MDEDFIPFPAKTYDNPVVISNDGAPWLSTKTNLQPNNIQTSPLVKLHNEIIQFADFMSLTKAELDERDLIIKEVEVIIKTISPTAKVKPFGSYISKMLTPMSDIDLVVVDESDNINTSINTCAMLHKIADGIRNANIASYLEVVESAKVPIVKFDHVTYGISVDIVYNNLSGLSTGKMMKKYVREYPPLRPLALFLKIFLTQRKLNDTYTGGIGSFVLSTMIVSFLQMRQNICHNSSYIVHMDKRMDNGTESYMTWNLGSLLLEFLNLYGNSLNYTDVGISIVNGGSYFSKYDHDWGESANQFQNTITRPNLLSLENPDDRTLDMGRNSYNMPKIKRAFEHGCMVLVATLQSRQTKSSILSYLVRTDDSFFMERIAARGNNTSNDSNGQESTSSSTIVSIIPSPNKTSYDNMLRDRKKNSNKRNYEDDDALDEAMYKSRQKEKK